MKGIKRYIEKFSKLVCSIDEDHKPLDEINAYFAKHPIINDGMHGRVWFLIGKERNENKYCVLNVAQSEDIKKEIVDNVRSMLNLTYLEKKQACKTLSIEEEMKYNLDVIKSPILSSPSAEGYQYPYQQGNSETPYFYRFAYKNYLSLKIYELDIDSYLHIDFSEQAGEVFRNLYSFGKDYYAEAKLAVKTHAKYWRYYRSGIGKRAYKFFSSKEEPHSS